MNVIDEKFKKYLCPPGNGVYTVHTAKENKEALHNKLYSTSEPEQVQAQWMKSFETLQSSNLPCLLGVTSDTGGGIQRGANWGPLFIRTQMLNHSKARFFDIGDIRTIPHFLHDKYLNQETISSCREALYGDANVLLPVSPLSIAEDFCHEFYKKFPDKALISLGGDHSVSYSLVKPWIMAKKAAHKKMAIIHFDAHTDLMKKRLGVDICFGSWAYHMIELLDSPGDLIQLGIRSSGQKQNHWEDTLGIKQYWTHEIIDKGAAFIAQKIVDGLKEKAIDELYISFDIDALDSEFASATGTPETQGLSPAQCLEIIDLIAKNFKVSGCDLVEVAPFVRSTHESHKKEPETTLKSSQLILDKFMEITSKCP